MLAIERQEAQGKLAGDIGRCIGDALRAGVLLTEADVRYVLTEIMRSLSEGCRLNLAEIQADHERHVVACLKRRR